ncbi:tetratricopeptide repeat protein [Azospirillum halopraeferens]|uniref:tetratricopeptide repeat protein n=1 Tax=Azospirillum halopraeferens TaxID=34010 RepID=UPI0004256F8C|nr:tetratricopeptide repeat protein [Azospirillum halopraeferens]
MSIAPSLYGFGDSPPAGGDAGATTLEACFETGFQRLYAGDSAAAEAAFRTAVALAPDSAEARAALAEALSAAGRPGEAAQAFAEALARDSSPWPWRFGRAEALAEAGAPDAAVAAFRDLAAERPDAAAVRRGLARALVRAGRPAEAVGEYREAVFLRPDDVATAIELGALLTAAGEAPAALELLQPLVRRCPDEARLHLEVGRAWIELREAGKALAALRRARALDEADVCGAAELIAALEGGALADLTPAYVRALFDRYADRFDADLVGKLDYRGPALVREALERVGGTPSGLRILDLGCGTGLAGVELRPWADWLAGVDLAPRMVEKAAARGLYDEVRVCDIGAALWATPGSWDVLAAADVLVYVGDLTPLFAAAAAALRPGGRFAATAERLDGAEGFALGPARRYAHTRGHIEQAAAAAGLTVRLLEPCSPRREKQVPVAGWVFVLETPAG